MTNNKFLSSFSVLDLVTLPTDLAMLLGEAKILYFDYHDASTTNQIIEKIYKELPKRGITLKIHPLSAV